MYSRCVFDHLFYEPFYILLPALLYTWRKSTDQNVLNLADVKLINLNFDKTESDRCCGKERVWLTRLILSMILWYLWGVCSMTCPTSKGEVKKELLALKLCLGYVSLSHTFHSIGQEGTIWLLASCTLHTRFQWSDTHACPRSAN